MTRTQWFTRGSRVSHHRLSIQFHSETRNLSFRWGFKFWFVFANFIYHHKESFTYLIQPVRQANKTSELNFSITRMNYISIFLILVNKVLNIFSIKSDFFFYKVVFKLTAANPICSSSVNTRMKIKTVEKQLN